MEELFMEIARQGPLFTALVVAIVWFNSKLKIKDAEIDNLNQEIREINKENVSLLYKINETLNKIIKKNED